MGRTLIGVWSILGILLYVGFGVVVFGLALAPEIPTNLISFAKSIVWVIATMPLVFMVYYDVKNKNKASPEAESNKSIAKMPLFWMVLVLITGPIGGFIYYFYTKHEDTSTSIPTKQKYSRRQAA